MAKIVASLKILPIDINIDLNILRDEVEKTLPESASIYKFEEDPIAFGLVALIAHIILPEEGEEMNKIEKAIMDLKEVSQLETLMVRKV
jgi:translation elongation factor aEF-1 beta